MQEPPDPYEDVKHTIIADLGCEDGNAPPTLEWIQTNIFTPSCVASRCHNSDSELEDLDLNPEMAFTHLMNKPSQYQDKMPLIDPGNAENSYLVVSMGAYGHGALETRSMPTNQFLCDAKVQAVARWVALGALPTAELEIPEQVTE